MLVITSSVQCFRVSPLLILVAIPRADEHEMRPTRDYCPRLWDVTLKTGILIVSFRLLRAKIDVCMAVQSDMGT